MILQPPFHTLIQAGKSKSRDLSMAVLTSTVAAGGSEHVDPRRLPSEGTPVFVGMVPVLADRLREAQQQGRQYLALDNGYFRPYRQGGYFRGTVDGLQQETVLSASPDRFQALEIQIEPWKKAGGHILVVLQSRLWFEMFVGCRDVWLAKTLAEIRKHTDREIRVREKPAKHGPLVHPLGVDLDDAWAVVALSSNVMVQALIKGIPVVPMAPCAATPLGTPMARIETPVYADREPWAWSLAASQWTLEEMISGRMIYDLRKGSDRA